jgi:hypothetical protein
MVVPELAVKLVGHDINPLYTFPVIFSISVVGCPLGTLLSKSEDGAILKQFYKTVNPWGAWGPIRDKVMRNDPAFQPNRDCSRDCANVMVGIVWQLCLTALPIYLVLRQWSWVGAIAATLGVTSLIIKFNWYDKLAKAPAGIGRGEQPLPAQTTML